MVGRASLPKFYPAIIPSLAVHLPNNVKNHALRIDSLRLIASKSGDSIISSSEELDSEKSWLFSILPPKVNLQNYTYRTPISMFRYCTILSVLSLLWVHNSDWEQYLTVLSIFVIFHSAGPFLWSNPKLVLDLVPSCNSHWILPILRLSKIFSINLEGRYT